MIRALTLATVLAISPKFMGETTLIYSVGPYTAFTVGPNGKTTCYRITQKELDMLHNDGGAGLYFALCSRRKHHPRHSVLPTGMPTPPTSEKE